MNERPAFPRRAVVTAGMPYGNKELHFGHIGGVFIQADIFARFLRDRLGEENVLFVSGTDCYGITIETSYQKAKENGFIGSIQDYVASIHKLQKNTLDAYHISPNLFAASALEEAGELHADFSAKIFERLYKKGVLKREKSLQFYDRKKGLFLNGRQVTGRCPIQGCKSEIAYADECALGHQYAPSELIAPISVLSGETPVQVAVDNWFFDLPAFSGALKNTFGDWEYTHAVRQNFLRIAGEFLRKPAVFVKKEFAYEAQSLNGMPSCTVKEDPSKASWALVFENLAARDTARSVLEKNGIRYRTGKTVVPFRLSGNVKWGVPVPEKEGLAGLTFWVWPESLWAPISFTKAVLGDGKDGCAWETWWKSEDSKVYQFIGEDNVYFYGIAEIGLFSALDEGFRLPIVIPNHHLLYGKRKASSSGAVKPPLAKELLAYYTPEQLRLHFMNASLSEKSVSFEPKALLGSAGEFDPVLNEGNLVTNIFNRLVRSCFYTNQKYNEGKHPVGTVSPHIKEKADAVILAYERLMAGYAFDKLFELLNLFLRDANKEWAVRSKSDSRDEILQLLTDMFHVVRVAVTLFHPITPAGCERIREYLQVDVRIWNWEYIFEPLDIFFAPDHTFRVLEPRVDFFEKHPSQR